MKFHIYSLNKNISFRIKSNTAISKRGTQDPIDENDGKKLKIDAIEEGPDNSSDIVELTPVCELVVMADQAEEFLLDLSQSTTSQRSTANATCDISSLSVELPVNTDTNQGT